MGCDYEKDRRPGWDVDGTHNGGLAENGNVSMIEDASIR